MMNKEFVTYNQSLALKELGFDEPCVYYVDKDNESYIYNFETHPDEFIEWCGVNVIPAPTFSQAFRWFREKYKLYFSSHYSNLNYIGKWQWLITYEDNAKASDFVNTYEEAELACLIKLIEIVKNDNTNN